MKSQSYKSYVLIGSALVVATAWVTYMFTSPSKQVLQTTIEPSFLYVQTAQSGSLVPTEQEGLWTLTLDRVSPNTVYFSDRPNRITGQESTESFILDWDQGEDSFQNNPPNAALDIFGGDGGQSVLVVELMSAAYNLENQSLEYKVVILDGSPEDSTIYDSFNQTALFIDSNYKSYNCKCNPPAAEDSCKCSYSYKLKKSTTKEFRASCKGTGTNADVGVADRRPNTTCTTPIDFGLGYMTKSCTNWSTEHSDEVTVKVKCKY